LVRGIVFQCEFGDSLVHGVLQPCQALSNCDLIASTISVILNGCPDTLLNCFASIRYSDRSTFTSCPVFISGTSILSYALSSASRLLGMGHRCRRWICATSSPSARQRLTA